MLSANCQKNFSKLKIIKNDTIYETNFDELIDSFTERETFRVKLDQEQKEEIFVI